MSRQSYVDLLGAVCDRLGSEGRRPVGSPVPGDAAEYYALAVTRLTAARLAYRAELAGRTGMPRFGTDGGWAGLDDDDTDGVICSLEDRFGHLVRRRFPSLHSAAGAGLSWATAAALCPHLFGDPDLPSAQEWCRFYEGRNVLDPDARATIGSVDWCPAWPELAPDGTLSGDVVDREGYLAIKILTVVKLSNGLVHALSPDPAGGEPDWEARYGAGVRVVERHECEGACYA
jgi:hypothetical protein